MRIKVLKLGHSANVVEVGDNTTVRDAIQAAGHEIQGYSLTINGLGCGPDASVSEGDVLTLSPKVQGG